MFFLLRCAFWIGLVLLLLPIDTGPDESPTAGLSPVQAFFAAQSTISDLSGFCERNPETCATGGQAISRIGEKAKVSAKLLYDYMDEDGTLVTGATGTLSASDLEPDWALDLPAAGSQAPVTATAPASETVDVSPNAALPMPRPRPGA
ncbi:DUF5330 domain-containing protein [Stappia sp. ES.058]|uniref:DUF5330 domain-containing protein n=1 Tax=Stappia sp. ES.058 TaxID=1881061 RepID=UPI00087D85CB|nr:DUF5330 domain-containing protein [Stappia sp. ES.058]SDT98536.1 hypothetical protein SAMN05428979_0920 [Stappia sp. ES.058]